jgi:hypothetical protein
VVSSLWQVTKRINVPRLGWIVSGLGVLLVFGFGLGVYMVLASDWGNHPSSVYSSWFAGGLFTMGVSGGVCSLLVTWHAFAQREVAIENRLLRVRRWIEVLTGQPGRTVPLSRIRSVAFIVRSGGAKLLIDADEEWVFSIWFWSRTDAQALHDALDASGVKVTWSIP